MGVVLISINDKVKVQYRKVTLMLLGHNEIINKDQPAIKGWMSWKEWGEKQCYIPFRWKGWEPEKKRQ